ncbi:sterol carrier protein 2-like [Sycon ciliatum]|uniref:sterol carrier protein 2-like n=1 Tax=Sycon ciliatum TaxID=27933 RepID=UPI0020ACFB71|eukprot:scpid53098/ scgid16665/ Non-specific lipid-transfer protein; Propanoyl-CoA C-acyltransferase; SCP-chi; SCPX; Sterol carrier protein 2; Sterol carrier protein X
MASSKRKVFVVGVGMTKFEKPGRREDFDYPQMAEEAGQRALDDAGIPYSAVQQAVVGYVYGDSSCGQRALYGLGMTGIPIYNVNNNCATGSSALFIGKQLIEGGLCDCIMALGFEKMERGSLGAKFTDRTIPMDRHMGVMTEIEELSGAPPTPQMFGNAGREHMRKYGTTLDHFAKIAEKNHNHSVNNPYSQFQKSYTLEQIKTSPAVHEPLTKLQCCPTSDGGAAVIIASEDFVRRNGLEPQAIEIVAMEMATDFPSTFHEKSSMKLVGYDMTKAAADRVFMKAGCRINDVDVVELHDCFSANELITYEALGLCQPGEAGAFIDRGDNTYGGKYVVNPSGGLISKGHPLGATGLAQCSELTWQLRGVCGKRQVSNAQLALQHNVGLGGAVVVALYRHGFPAFKGQRSATSARPNYAIQSTAAAKDVSEFKAKLVFDELKKRLDAEPGLAKKVNATFLFKIRNGPGNQEASWFADLKSSPPTISVGEGKAQCTITMKDADFLDMMTGKLDGQQAFFKGKLKISGNMMLANKLKDLQPRGGKSKL